MFRCSTLALFIGLTALCFGLPASIKIIGGENASEGELPYQVGIRLTDWNLSFCGGALVEVNQKQFVLTAASCIYYQDDSIQRFKFVVGDLKSSEISGKEQLQISNRFIWHPNFIPETKRNDIAIVGFEKPFNLSDVVQPIALPQQGQNTSGDVLISGWGGVSETDYNDADNLQKLRIPLISREECEDAYRNATSHFWPLSTMLCAWSRDHLVNSHCYGDRGGPVVSIDGGYLAGIMSFPETCMSQEKGYPDVYTDVAQYVDWINNVANDL